MSSLGMLVMVGEWRQAWSVTWVAKCGIECLLADIGGSFLQRALLNRTDPKGFGPHSYVCKNQGGGRKAQLLCFHSRVQRAWNGIDQA